MDTITPEMRSKVMSAIHSRDTLSEMRVRKMLWANGYRFRVCDRRIVGHPDIVVPKFRRNVCRDAEHEKAWAADGWNLIVVWECALKTEKEREKTFAFILRHVARWASEP